MQLAPIVTLIWNSWYWVAPPDSVLSPQSQSVNQPYPHLLLLPLTRATPARTIN